MPVAVIPDLKISREIKPYIKATLYENLYVLPYERGRLVFAQLAARALEENQFDLVVVDLPQFMNDGTWTDIPLQAFPAATTIIIKRDDLQYLWLPLAPNDAGCLALYLAKTKQMHCECVDDSNLINYPDGSLFQPDTGVREDYFIFHEGLDNYFARPWDLCAQQWLRATELQKLFSAYRASLIARRLRKLFSCSAKILFVCESLLWWMVRGVLAGELEESSAFPHLPRWQDKDAAFVIDPHLLWVKGALDDYPAVNVQFFESVLRGNSVSFDKLHSLNRITSDFIQGMGHHGSTDLSVRSLLTFTQYLRNRLAVFRRIVPQPGNDLLDAARACLGKAAAMELARELLTYPPADLMETAQTAIFLSIGRKGIQKSTKSFDIPDMCDAAAYYGDASCSASAFCTKEDERGRQRWVNSIHPYLTRKERKGLTTALSEKGMWAIKEDYRTHAEACLYLREIIKRDARAIRIEKSSGSMGDGIHWRATISAMARGEDAVHIKRRERNKLHQASLDEYTPVVFLFAQNIDECLPTFVQSGNNTHRRVQLGESRSVCDEAQRADKVYSIFKTILQQNYFLEGHIRKDCLTAIALLCTNDLMEVARYKAICSRPRLLQCRADAQEDSELDEFIIRDKLVAWAIKYAESAVIVVADTGWRASERLSQFARKKRVKLLNLPLSVLPADSLKRLRHMHFISRSLRIHPDRTSIVQRFLHSYYAL